MREIFHRELDQLVEQLVEMTRLVDTAMYRATTALLDADLALAESVIAADAAVDGFHRDLDERALELIARQQPVAGDLRTILASLRMSADLERMGDLARHVAELAQRRGGAVHRGVDQPGHYIEDGKYMVRAEIPGTDPHPL